MRALLAAGLYDRAEEQAYDEVAKVRVAHGDNALQVATASDLLVRALIVNGRAAHDQTIALARRALALKESHLGTQHPQLVPSLLNMGDVLADTADFKEAITVTTRALTLQERSAGSDSLDTAEALDHLGSILSSARRDDDALKALDRSLLIKTARLDEKDVAIARTLETIGLTLQRMGAYERSGPPVRRAATIQEATSVDHPAYVGTLNLLAQQLWFEGRLLDSKNVSDRAVALAERALRPDHPSAALAVLFLGETLLDLGDFEPSRTLTALALAKAERNFGADHHQTAVYVHAVAYAALRDGNYVVARQRFRHALRILEARYGPWHTDVATALSMLARTDALLGDYVSARREQSRAVTIHERVGGPNHSFVANALTDLARVHREEGSLAEALRLLRRALAIREKNLTPNHRDVARTLVDIASTLVQAGQLTQAQAAATRAIDIWDRVGTPDAPDYATALALYARLQSRRGDQLAARNYYQRAMSIREKVFGTSHPEFADAQAGFAYALANLGEHGPARSNAVSAEAAGRTHLRTMLRSLPERQSLEYAAIRPQAVDLILSLTGSVAGVAESALDTVIRSRAMVLDEMAARRRTQPSETDDPLRVAYTTAQQRLANLMVRGPGQLSATQYAAALGDARAESERAEQALAERSVEFRVERNRAQLGLNEVMAALPAESVLISFVRYERTIFSDSATKVSSNGPTQRARNVPSYVALVTREQQPPVAIPLGSARTIDSLVAQWRADISAEAAPARIAREAPVPSRTSGVALRRAIWDPVSAFLGKTKRVFIVPDGSLSLVPFVALPVGQRSYLIERAPVIHYLSSERDLVPPPTEGGSIGQGLLAVGGPAFDDPTLFAAGKKKPASARTTTTPSPTAALRSAGTPCDASLGVRGTFPALRGTLQEVRELAAVWNTSVTTQDEVSRVLARHEASEPTIKKDAHRYRVLHLATHGFFLGDSCLPAREGTRAVGGLVSTSPKQAGGAIATNPLLLSGLALAGANRRQVAAPTEDDGILTAEEVASLNLGGVQWAVLSACDTGLGEVRAGEGVLGLRRAFQIAGARTVIMSLWSVEDEATRLWMRALYEGRLKRNLNTADAMHEASLLVLRARRTAGQPTHPFFWAAFVAAGDWR